MTFPGPCATQVGEGIGIDVGVDVSAGVAVDVAVKYWIAGIAVKVDVGVPFGVATVPVQADNKNKTPTSILIFFIIPSTLKGDDSDPREYAVHPM